MSWKDKFIIYVFIGIMIILFGLIVFNHDKEQPSVEDVMTNNGPTISDFIK